MNNETFTGTLTDGAGDTIEVTETLTPAAPAPVIPPPPPVVDPPPPVVVVVPPPTTGGGTVTGGILAGMAGQTYGSNGWLDSFKREANGNIDLTILIPSNACIISEAGTPGHQPTDFADFNSAQNAAIANKSFCILFRDGGTYSGAAENNNIQNMSGTAARPVIIGRIGRNGFYTDHSLPLPNLQGGRLGISHGPNSGPVHFIIIAGLDFTNPGSTQGAPIYFVDQSLGAASDHIGVFDCHVTGYQSAMDFESGDPLHYPNQTFVLDGCTITNCIGGADSPGMYLFYIRDLLVNRCYFIGNGAKNQMGTAHGIYLNSRYQDSTDNQIRFVNTVFGASAAVGCECNRGGFFNKVLSLANPIGFYGGGGAAAEISHCVVDGGGGEFDSTPVKFASQTGVPAGPGSALSLQPGTGANRGWGCYLDTATTGSIHDTYIINKPELFNSGLAVGVHTLDVGKQFLGMPSASTVATLGPNLIVHNWKEWSADGKGSPNFVNLAGNNAPAATINYTGLVVLPGVTGVAGVTAVEPKYVDDTRTSSSYAKTLGITGVNDGPTLLQRMSQQRSTNWDVRLEASAVFDFIEAGFQVAA